MKIDIKEKEFIQKKYPPRTFSKFVGGFTLIELMIVIGVITLLVSFFLVGLSRYRNNARDAGIKTLLLEIRNVAELYHDDSHTYVGVCDQERTGPCQIMAISGLLKHQLIAMEAL